MRSGSFDVSIFNILIQSDFGIIMIVESLRYTVGYLPTFNVQGINKLAGLGESMDHRLFPVDSMEETVQ